MPDVWEPVDESGLSDADRFCVLACLRYDAEDAPPRREAALDLLAAVPGLVEESVYVATAAGEVAAVRRHLERDVASATLPGGPYVWEPLLYLCYSRAIVGSEADVLELAGLLFGAGANPNAAVLWRGLTPPFTALTGVFGEGEQGVKRQPRHPYAPSLARLLLEEGADPNDGQALYNRMFGRTNEHLELLFSYGLNAADDLARQLSWAAHHGMTQRLQLLADNGVPVPDGAWELARATADGGVVGPDRTPLHDAAFDGDLDRIRRLLDAGADPQARDSRFDATPLGWAEHAYQSEAADLLRTVTSDST